MNVRVLQDRRLREDVLELWSQATALVHGLVEPPHGPDDFATAEAMLSDVGESVLAAVDAGAELPPGEAAKLLAGLLRIDDQLAAARAARRVRTYSRMRESLARLGVVESPAAMLRAAPAEFCGCGYERALLTLVEDGACVPAVLHDTVDPRGAHARLTRLCERSWTTGSLPAPERAALKRRTPLLVTSPGRWEHETEPGFGSELDLGSHIIAAVVSAGGPVALLHVAGAGMETFDRDLVWTLAEGLGHAHERRVLVNRIASLRAEVRRMTHSLEAVMNESAESAIELASLAPDDDGAQSMATLVVFGGPDVLSSLTPREREVMELMALGLTNPAIAEELVVTTGTVKSHVKNILRKLRAGNRAEAIARYIQLSRA